jgi:parallel beta-helix repeat protein
MTEPVILLVGTADTKSDELAFLRERVQALGAQVLLMDVGVLAAGHVSVDITHTEVAQAACTTLQAVMDSGDENTARQAMAQGAALTAARLHAEGRIHGLLALGMASHVVSQKAQELAEYWVRLLQGLRGLESASAPPASSVDVDSFLYSASAGDVTLSNNVVAWNEITDTVYGAGIATWGLTKPTLLNNIVYQNVGEGVWLNDATTFKYNDVYGNTTAYAGELSSQTGLNGNVAVDPLFTGVSNDGVWTNDDWTLRSTSTLINAGSTTITDVDGSRSDMGAYGGPYGVW